jgi:hypothetical protein
MLNHVARFGLQRSDGAAQLHDFGNDDFRRSAVNLADADRGRV